MQRCIQLALCGEMGAAPNPMVGALLVCDGLIVGEGFHVRCGGPHAEVNAIASVRDKGLLRRSTLYVSLEPCAHYGKTPPCADLIIEMGIPRVVVGCQDPFAKVNGCQGGRPGGRVPTSQQAVHDLPPEAKALGYPQVGPEQRWVHRRQEGTGWETCEIVQ